jgi:hypothetical protein
LSCTRGRPTIGVEGFLNIAVVPHKIELQVSANLTDWISISESLTFSYYDPIELGKNRVRLYVKESDIPIDARFLRIKIEQY